MIGVELVEDKTSKKPASKRASEVMTRSWRRGVAVITCGKSTIRLAPPLTITRELVDSGLEIICPKTLPKQWKQGDQDPCAHMMAEMGQHELGNKVFRRYS